MRELEEKAFLRGKLAGMDDMAQKVVQKMTEEGGDRPVWIKRRSAETRTGTRKDEVLASGRPKPKVSGRKAR